MNGKILFVDDDRNLLASWERSLGRQFCLETAEGGEAALAGLVQRGPYAVVVADRQMPGMDGIELLAAARHRAPDTVRVMLTGNADLESTIRVVNEGSIFRFLTKPCPLDLLSVALRDALAQHQLITVEKELLNKTLGGSIKLLTDILSTVDPQSFGRSQNLRETITRLANKLNLKDAWQIHLAVMLAPIGYVTIPPATLVRFHDGQRLSAAEEQMLTSVPETTARLLTNVPRLQGVAHIVRYLHKDFNGMGFPIDSCSGDAIPVGSRLLRILLDLAQLQAKGKTRSAAFDEMTRDACYDPALLSAVGAELGIATGVEATAPGATTTVAFQRLIPGMVIRSNVETTDGLLVLSAGHVLTEITLEKLRNFHRLAGIKEPIQVEGHPVLKPSTYE